MSRTNPNEFHRMPSMHSCVSGGLAIRCLSRASKDAEASKWFLGNNG